MKKVISTLLSVTFGIGLCTGCKTESKEVTVEDTISSIVEEISIPDITRPCKDVSTKKVTTTAKVKVTLPKANKNGISITSKNPYISKNLGTFSLTFYIPDATWGYSTSTGVKSTHLKTCAVDPKVIPYGSVIQITGNNGQTITLKAVDCGGGIKGNKIDIFWDSNIYGLQAGYSWMGRFGTLHDVYLLEE